MELPVLAAAELNTLTTLIVFVGGSFGDEIC